MSSSPTTHFRLEVDPGTHDTQLSARPGRAVEPMRFMQALNAEWERLCDEHSTVVAVRRWAVLQPALQGLHCLTDITDAVAQRGLATVAGGDGCLDELLLALLTLAQHGEELAGRTVVQLFMGRAVRLTRSQVRVTGAETAEVEAQVITALWEAVTTYPLQRRRQRVAANLALDALRLTQRRWVFAGPGHSRSGTVTEVSIFDQEDCDPLMNATGDHKPTAWARVARLLGDSAAHGAITDEQARLLMQVYAPLPGQAQGVAETAAQLGISSETLHRRLSRLSARLVQYLKDVEREGHHGHLSPTATPRLGADPLELMQAA